MTFLLIIIIFILLFIFFLKYKKPNSTPPYQIIVAKYNEDVSWLDGYKNVIVYDKLNDKDLPNIGRESHTYLTYIIENYDNLPDVVFFTQGNISEHNYSNISGFLNVENFSKNLKEYPFNYYFYCKNLGWNNDHLYYWKGPLYPKEELGFTQWFKKYIDNEYDINSGITFWMGAIFSVSKELIQARPKEYYQMLLDLIPKTHNPEVGHYFERSWFYIFNCHKK